MTLQDIEKSLPYGFENAIIWDIQIRYGKRDAEMHLSVVVGENNQHSDYRLRILLTGLLYFVIEPQHPNYFDDYLEDGPGRVWVSNSEAHQWAGAEGTSQGLKKLQLPDGAFTFRLLVHDWNAYIHIAAMSATVERV
ncbi:MAG: hypothetical protein ACLPXM_13120 [Terriglobales bacterium]